MKSTRTCRTDTDTHVSHSVSLPECCPISCNPRPGSELVIHYRPNGLVLPVEDLSSWIEEYVGGHPDGVREMETIIQDLAERVSKSIEASVTAVANLRISPPFGGAEQGMRVVVKAKYVPLNAPKA